jgi:hypothetical protein
MSPSANFTTYRPQARAMLRQMGSITTPIAYRGPKLPAVVACSGSCSALAPAFSSTQLKSSKTLLQPILTRKVHKIPTWTMGALIWTSQFAKNYR